MTWAVIRERLDLYEKLMRLDKPQRAVILPWFGAGFKRVSR